MHVLGIFLRTPNPYLDTIRGLLVYHIIQFPGPYRLVGLHTALGSSTIKWRHPTTEGLTKRGLYDTYLFVTKVSQKFGLLWAVNVCCEKM